MTMTKQQFKQSLKKLSQLRKAEIIVYITGDKKPEQRFGTLIALDVLPLFYQHLSKIGKQRKISLFLYSCGGHLNAPWPIVNLIREYCEEFEVIIPSKALSAATLVSVGADKILMTPLSQLSPVDPIGTFQVTEGKQESISIEDVTGFINFAKEKIGIAEQGALAEVLKKLTDQIKPSILGSINRTHSLIRELTKKLLKSHRNKIDEERTEKIVEKLTEKLFSHQYFINRREAKETVGFGEIIQYASLEEEKLINGILEYYQDKLEINKEFNPMEILKDNVEKEYSLIRAVIYSLKQENNFVSKYKIVKMPSPKGQISINVIPFYNKWE